MTRYALALALLLAAWPAMAQDADIPAVDALEPVTVAPTEAKTYAKQYPILLVYRYIDADGDGQWRPVLQRLTLAPARLEADGSIEVLLDESTHTSLADVDLRAERGRSPVFRRMMDTFVEVMGLMAKERGLAAAIAAAKAEDPEADTSAQEAALANIRAALEIAAE